MKRFCTTIALGAFLMSGAQAQALVPLQEDKTVIARFYAIGLADEVRDHCPTISPRMFRALTYLRSIASYAREAGYSDDQIRALTENKVEKEKMRARVRADLAKRGAVPGNPEAYCVVGREEIAKNSASGRLLKE